MPEEIKEPVVEAPTEPVEPNLEAQRDERVVPVARGVLKDIADGKPATGEDQTSEFQEVIMKGLKRSLDADLNLTTDNPYIFQLVLGVFGAFSAVMQKATFAQQQDEKFARIAHETMALLVSVEVPMGTKVKAEEQIAALEGILPQLNELFARENITWLEMKYILEGMFNALKTTEASFMNSVAQGLQRMEAKILGIQDLSDLTMRKLDETLQADINPQTRD